MKLIELTRSQTASTSEMTGFASSRCPSGVKRVSAPNASRHAPFRYSGSRSRYGWSSASTAPDQPSLSSHRFHTSASTPPGTSTRWISPNAASFANQWNACATVTASTLAVGSGIACAVPSWSSAAGTCSASSPRISADGSTATTRAPVETSSRVSLPVPAARSSTVAPARSPSRDVRSSTAARGYPGRARS
jgi:hypothetical protein